jgi:spore coat protein U-like protein
MRKGLATGVLGLSVTLAGAAHAQGCSTSATAAAFGTYQPLAGTTATTTSTISVTCTAVVSLLISYTVKLNAGNYGTVAARKMSGSSWLLGYQLYLDAGYTQAWGDGSLGTSFVMDGYTLGIGTVTRTYTAYGRVPASQSVGPASYTDTVTVLLTY